MAIPSFITTTTEIVDIGRASCRAGTGSIVIDDGIVGGVSLLLPFGFDSRFDSGEFVIVDRLGNCGGIAGVLFYLENRPPQSPHAYESNYHGSVYEYEKE